MKYSLLYLLLIVCHFIHGQEKVFDETNYGVIIQNPEAYESLVLKNDVYKALIGLESKFINVKRIILTDVDNLKLPKSFGDYPKLEELIVANSNKINLKENIKQISRINHLNSLELTGCDIKCVPKSIILLNRTLVEKLSLSNNKIKQIPSEIGELKVKKLDMSGNPLRVKALNKLSSNKDIEELYLDYCDLKIYPKHLGKMSNLKLLSLTFNSIKQIGSSYNGFRELELLSLTGNPLKITDIDFIDNDKNVIVDFTR